MGEVSNKDSPITPGPHASAVFVFQAPSLGEFTHYHLIPELLNYDCQVPCLVCEVNRSIRPCILVKARILITRRYRWQQRSHKHHGEARVASLTDRPWSVQGVKFSPEICESRS